MFVKFVLLLFCLSLINAKTLIQRDSHHEAFGKKEMQYEKFPEDLKNIIQEAGKMLDEEERNIKVGANPQVQSESEDVDEDDDAKSSDFEEVLKDETAEEDLNSIANEIPNTSSPELFKFITDQFKLLKEALQNPTINKHANTIANLVDWRKLAKNFLPSFEKYLADKNLENFAENLGDDLLKQKIDVLEADNELTKTGKQNLDIYVDLDQPAVREFISQTISKNFGNFKFQDKLQGLMDMWMNKVNQDFKVPIQKEPEVNIEGLDK